MGVLAQHRRTFKKCNITRAVGIMCAVNITYAVGITSVGGITAGGITSAEDELPRARRAGGAQPRQRVRLRRAGNGNCDGIGIGAAGSDVAPETADVALLADNLEHLPFAVGLSRATTCVIRQNLWLSLGVVAVLAPSTILGLSIGAAVLAHEGSTVVVVVNALRLLAFKETVDKRCLPRLSARERAISQS